MPPSTLPFYADSTATTSGNPLDKPATFTPQDLTVEQTKYQTYLEQRLTRAQEVRDRRWAEFSDKTYLQYYEQNAKLANTYLEAVKNEGELKLSAGTIESKLNTLLSHVDNLNLTPEVLAYDKDDRNLKSLGVAFTDILDRTAEHDGGDDGGDTEKRIARQRELAVQGTVFVQEKWCTKKQMKKELSKKFDGKTAEWTSRLTTVFEGPERSILYGPNVYLGDITQFSMDDQPYVFTVDTMHLDKAKELYGTWENWKYVKPGQPPSTATLAQNAAGGRTIYDGKFRLTTLKDDQVEIIKYQDPTRDEFQIIVNGIMMLPIGFPLSAVTPGGKFNVTKQILYIINSQFAYGGSFVSSGDVYELSQVIDEMLRLFVLKTRKSITPPYVNISGRNISSKVLQPGVISQGIPPNALQAIGTESQGVTAGEYQIYKEIIDRVDRSTVSPIFQGQYGKANTTATEVLEVQRQARLALGIIISACTMLEVKLGYLRLWNILAHWFEPIETALGEDGMVKNEYRKVTREVDIEGAGRGSRMVIPVDGKLPTAEMVRQMEIMDEKATGYPSERIYVNPKKLKEAQLKWRVVVNPKERESSAYHKLMFREMLADAIGLVNLGARPNVQGLVNEFGSVYMVDQNKVFSDVGAGIANAVPPAPQQGGQANNAGGPTPAPAFSQQIGAGLGNAQ